MGLECHFRPELLTRVFRVSYGVTTSTTCRDPSDPLSSVLGALLTLSSMKRNTASSTTKPVHNTFWYGFDAVASKPYRCSCACGY